MFTLAGIRQFHGWTHGSLTLLLNHLSTIPATEYAKEVPGFGFPTIRAQVIHSELRGLSDQNAPKAHPFDDQDPTNWPSVSDARRLQSEVSRNLELSVKPERAAPGCCHRAAFLQWRHRGSNARTYPPSRSDSRLPSQGSDRLHVPYPGLSRSRHRSDQFE